MLDYDLLDIVSSQQSGNITSRIVVANYLDPLQADGQNKPITNEWHQSAVNFNGLAQPVDFGIGRSALLGEPLCLRQLRVEGAMALGLGYWQMMQKIILPQALKIVIPGIVNTFIGLFKDTTLVSIIGLLDFLGMINLSHSDSSWATPVQAITSYIFCAFVFWVFCYAMARYSNYMERRLDTSYR